MFNKITIIGVGLIGGSIGLAVKRKKIAKEIVGVCRHRSSLQRAKQKGAIDKGTLDYKKAVKDADLVVLTTPIKQIIKIGRQIGPSLSRGCLLTDAGSTKSEIVLRIEKALPEGVSFVGAHPLAGSEKGGVGEARADLFKGTKCILTRSGRTKSAALKQASIFWQMLGCQIAVLTPQMHDKAVSVISHLPHLAAVQLVKAGRKSFNFAAGGFLDSTRIASSEVEIWSDICLTNKRFIIQAIDKYLSGLRSMRNLISRDDKKGLASEFKTAKALRDALQK